MFRITAAMTKRSTFGNDILKKSPENKMTENQKSTAPALLTLLGIEEWNLQKIRQDQMLRWTLPLPRNRETICLRNLKTYRTETSSSHWIEICHLQWIWHWDVRFLEQTASPQGSPRFSSHTQRLPYQGIASAVQMPLLLYHLIKNYFEVGSRGIWREYHWRMHSGLWEDLNRPPSSTPLPFVDYRPATTTQCNPLPCISLRGKLSLEEKSATLSSAAMRRTSDGNCFWSKRLAHHRDRCKICNLINRGVLRISQHGQQDSGALPGNRWSRSFQSQLFLLFHNYHLLWSSLQPLHVCAKNTEQASTCTFKLCVRHVEEKQFPGLGPPGSFDKQNPPLSLTFPN